MGVKGNELHERAVNEVVDKELGCSIQVSHVSVVQQAMELSCTFACVPQNGEYIKKMNYMGQHNDWLERNGWAQLSNRIATYCADLCAINLRGNRRLPFFFEQTTLANVEDNWRLPFFLEQTTLANVEDNRRLPFFF